MSACSRSRTSLILLNCARTEAESGVAPLPSRAARTSSASSYLPLRISRRGESGKNGHMHQIKAVKTVLFLRRPRSAHTLQIAVTYDEKRVEQGRLTALKSQGKSPRDTTRSEGETQRQEIRKTKPRDTIRHLDDDQLATTPHLARLRLPDARGRGVHPRTQACNHSSGVHLVLRPAGRLHDGAQGDDAAPEQQRARPSESITGVQRR